MNNPSFYRRFTPAVLVVGQTCALLLGTALPASAQFPAGKPAPTFALKQVGGKRLPLASLRGKVVLLDFWGPS